MKFAEIPQVIRCSDGFHADLDDIDAVLDRWERSYGLDMDPDFQRGHVWTTEQQIKFVEFILKGGQVPPILFNSPAFGGHTVTGDLPDDVVLVDGKQRLTAINDFKEGLIPAFGHYIEDFEDADLMFRKVSIRFAVNKLQTRKELLTWYLELNEGHIAHSPEELERVRDLLEK